MVLIKLKTNTTKNIHLVIITILTNYLTIKVFNYNDLIIVKD
jgi:hypothetical protein